MITVGEAARRLGVSVAWIRRLCAEGRIKGASKIGRDWVIPAGAAVAPPVRRANTKRGRPRRTRRIPRR
ncbi:MAG: helix-turn-helix domain-containing protein [Gammaproteobacteria bacterium]